MNYDGSEIAVWKVRLVLGVFAAIVMLVISSPVIVREVLKVMM